MVFHNLVTQYLFLFMGSTWSMQAFFSLKIQTFTGKNKYLNCNDQFKLKIHRLQTDCSLQVILAHLPISKLTIG